MDVDSFLMPPAGTLTQQCLWFIPGRSQTVSWILLCPYIFVVVHVLVVGGVHCTLTRLLDTENASVQINHFSLKSLGTANNTQTSNVPYTIR